LEQRVGDCGVKGRAPREAVAQQCESARFRHETAGDSSEKAVIELRSSHLTWNAVVEKPERAVSDQVFGIIPEIRPRNRSLAQVVMIAGEAPLATVPVS
jgi:hypothetical protein